MRSRWQLALDSLNLFSASGLRVPNFSIEIVLERQRALAEREHAGRMDDERLAVCGRLDLAQADVQVVVGRQIGAPVARVGQLALQQVQQVFGLLREWPAAGRPR